MNDCVVAWLPRRNHIPKVAVVTGAGQGIGFAIAKRLVQDGFKVGVLDYNAETAEKVVAELSADKAFAVVADVSKQVEVTAAFQKVVDHFGDLNVVVNNACVGLSIARWMKLVET